MVVGQFFLVLAGACQFGHGAGGFTANFVHPYLMVHCLLLAPRWAASVRHH